ncbi:type VI secretion system protein VasD [Paracoccus alcaliphilus]|uniref:Type VI secretion system protein VasD n=1 Tax=Paracoccus alcaliphilus TaxID=34002 RepID=A0A1H8EFX0_9RHOB|nr:type VI secretion system lipoprotein TssJ [Paracoccus alcaliphilus]WCR20953.1 type VI secretion system lipoprotein TssJ [Paracoccus alcaliphilus]SEN18296.1 type VI secretion system protein VasD [Paracoccus alcaliphilus]
MTSDLHRRTFLATGAAGAVMLAGCGAEAPTPPTVLAVTAQGSAGMNPGPDGADRPVTVSILQLSGTAAFDGADYFALQDPAAALGSELVRAEQIVLAPGGSGARSIAVQPGVTAIGVTAGFRDPTGRTVRQRIAVPPASTGLSISVGRGGLTVSTG